MITEKCNEWVARDKKVIAKCQHLSYYPLVVEKGKGEIITDADGNEYIDFLSSASSINLGTCNEIITKAIKEQLEKYTQYTPAYLYNKPTIEYAECLTKIFPRRKPEDVQVCFGNCGSDANDAAVKFARAYTGRSKIITFLNSYHGSTYGSAALSACSPKMQEKMGPFMPEVYHFTFYGTDAEVADGDYIKEIRTAFNTYLPAKDVAAVIIEPIQGDGGILPAHPEFMKQLYELCVENGILFISEEVQQGFWRTGKWFSIENYGPSIVPDGIIMGKSLGGSLSLGAFMARKDIMETLPAPAHVFTLGGNAVACAAGVAAFNYYNTEEFQSILTENIKCLKDCAEKLKAEHPDIVKFVRGEGMSYGIGIFRKDDAGNSKEDADGTFKILYRAYEKGLIVISLAGNILRIQPPVNIPKESLIKGFDIISSAIDDYKKGLIPDAVFEFRNGW